MPDEMELTREMFIERFVNHMVLVGGTEFADGSSIEEYAREVAPTYWEDADQREDGPEACAEGDIDCWDYAG